MLCNDNEKTRKIRSMMFKLRSQQLSMTPQQFRTIKGQIIAGDFVGAEKGLDRIQKKSLFSKALS